MEERDGALQELTDYPGLFQGADEASLRSQRSYLVGFGVRLSLAVLAAASAAITVRVGGSNTDAAAIVTALAFVGALAVDVSLFRGRPDRNWYQGRALAESVKTLSWRYAVGGAPFAQSMPADAADRLFLERIQEIRRDLPMVAMLPTTAPPITEQMRRLRAAPRAERQRAYLDGRVMQQLRWYAAKAGYHHKWAMWFRLSLLALEIVGVAGALAKAFGVVNFDLAGIIAATVAALAAWTSARQHDTTATAYAVTTHELSVIGKLLRREHTERAWAVSVSDAEEAMSREHTLWRASHGG